MRGCVDRAEGDKISLLKCNKRCFINVKGEIPGHILSRSISISVPPPYARRSKTSPLVLQLGASWHLWVTFKSYIFSSISDLF